MCASLENPPSGKKKRVAHNGSVPTPPASSTPPYRDPPLYRRRCTRVPLGISEIYIPRASYCRAKNGRNFIVSSIFSYVFTSGAREIVFLSSRCGVCPLRPDQPRAFSSASLLPLRVPHSCRRLEVKRKSWKIQRVVRRTS